MGHGFVSPQVVDLFQYRVLPGQPVSHQIAAHHRAGAADASPAVHVHRLPVFDGRVDVVEYRFHDASHRIVSQRSSCHHDRGQAPVVIAILLILLGEDNGIDDVDRAIGTHDVRLNDFSPINHNSVIFNHNG